MYDKINLEMEPNPNNKLDPKASYIYNHHLVWIPGTLNSIPISVGTIVKNVVKQEDGNFNFTIGMKKRIYRCHYGWAFVLNTPENLKKYNRYLKVRKAMEDLQELEVTLFQDILTLKGV